MKLVLERVKHIILGFFCLTECSQQQCRASNPNCEVDDARELGLCSFAFQLCLFVAKHGHTRASAKCRTLICEAAYGRELGLSCFCFPTLFLC
jgi:hypothetical protein